MDTLFSDDDQQRIANAIEAAEADTSGEIVPYVVLRSSDYEAVPWRAGVLGALAGLAGAALARLFAPSALSWLTYDSTALLLMLGGGALGAAIVPLLPLLTRWFAGTDRMAEAVHRRAMQAFVEEEVFATRDRTGILLFVSLLEHRIEVLADAGIYEHADDATWDDITARIRRGIESGQLADGLVDAIGKCGALLAEHGIDPHADDPDELPSRLRFRDE